VMVFGKVAVPAGGSMVTEAQELNTDLKDDTLLFKLLSLIAASATFKASLKPTSAIALSSKSEVSLLAFRLEQLVVNTRVKIDNLIICFMIK
jgi:hypothetical protein